MFRVLIIVNYSFSMLKCPPHPTFLSINQRAIISQNSQSAVIEARPPFQTYLCFPILMKCIFSPCLAEFLNRVGLTFRSLLFHVARKKGRSIVASILRNFATHHFAEGPRKLKNSKFAYIIKRFCSNVKQAENTHIFDMFHPIVLRGHFS